jgi:hypothetical protein
MSFLRRLLGGEPKTEGELGYFGLGDWWVSTFSEAERDYIEKIYQPMSIGGDSEKPLTEGRIQSTTQTVSSLLSGLAGWFKKPADLSIARRILAKAEEVTVKPVDQHYLYQEMIQAFYRSRELDPTALNDAVIACQKQIAIAVKVARLLKNEYPGEQLPAHVGYKQLAIILEKEQKYSEVIRLMKNAIAQGWNGDWENRIERCEKKLQR